jgi:hypothetical protein
MKDKDIKLTTIYVGVPTAIAAALEKMPNKTSVIREILIENSDRICSGELSKAAEYRQKEIRTRVAGAFKDEFGIISKTQCLEERVDIVASKLKAVSLNTRDTLEEQKKMRDDMEHLLTALKHEAKEFRKRMEKEFEEVVKEQLEDYEVTE